MSPSSGRAVIGGIPPGVTFSWIVLKPCWVRGKLVTETSERRDQAAAGRGCRLAQMSLLRRLRRRARLRLQRCQQLGRNLTFGQKLDDVFQLLDCSVDMAEHQVMVGQPPPVPVAPVPMVIVVIVPGPAAWSDVVDVDRTVRGPYRSVDRPIWPVNDV